MNPNRKNILLLLLLIVGVVALDQLTKQLVLDNLQLYEAYEPIPALADFFKITRSYNTGAAFGLLSNAGDLFLILAVVVVGALIYFYPRIPAEAVITRFATGLVCGGALGNAIDRIRHEHVIDFIHYQIPGLISNVSNLADHAIVFGVLLILFDNWRLERRAKADETTSTEETQTE